MTVLATAPFLAFFDSDGNPLSGGLVYTYAAGTTTPKATYTDNTGSTEMPNPIVLDSAGRATWWISGAYKYVVKDSEGNTIKTTDNVTSFSTLAEQADAFFQTFSGTGSQTAFTLSTDQGTESEGLMIFVNKGLQESVTNGSFATDSDWTKGTGWTIGSGVATASGAISTAISQTSAVTLVAGQAYAVTYTITRSAGGLIPSVGGYSGTERTASGTYREVIVCGSTQTLAFTGNGFTGTLDNVSITVADSAGFDIVSPTAYTINGVDLTFSTAPASGTNNIYVFAPSSLLGAASSAAAAAEASAAAALTSETNAATSASSAAGYAAAKNEWTFSSTTTMADPSTAGIRLNSATLSSVTAIAISDLSANSGNPDLGAWIDTWDDAGGSNSGSIFLFKDNGNFAIYNVNSVAIDNTTWHQIPVTYVASAGSFSNSDSLFIGFAASGTTTVTGGLPLTGGSLTGAVTSNSNIGTTGNIGVGTATPTQAVHIVGNNKKLYFDGTTNDFSFYNDGTQIIGRAETLGGSFMFIDNNRNVSIGASAAHASAQLDIPSTTKAFRPPVMTTAQKNAISSPQAGFRVYDTDLKSPANYDGTSWRQVMQHVKSGNTTRDISVTGTQSITGVGFTPRYIEIKAIVSGTATNSQGQDDGTTAHCIADNANVVSDTYVVDTSNSIRLLTGSGVFATAKVTTFGADGFTLTWAKTGSPTGTATILYTAFA